MLRTLGYYVCVNCVVFPVFHGECVEFGSTGSIKCGAFKYGVRSFGLFYEESVLYGVWMWERVVWFCCIKGRVEKNDEEEEGRIAWASWSFSRRNKHLRMVL